LVCSNYLGRWIRGDVSLEESITPV